MSDMLRERLHEDFARLSNRKSDSSTSDESVSSAFSEVNFEELGQFCLNLRHGRMTDFRIFDIGQIFRQNLPDVEYSET